MKISRNLYRIFVVCIYVRLNRGYYKDGLMNILTLNEEMLLTVILHLGDNAYGVTIMEKIREISPKKIVFGTLYNSLDKLVKKGYVVAAAGEPTPERGGRRKVYYTLTKKGKFGLEKTKEFHRALWDWIPD
jgi:PadR family transcriptional regulator PadR